MGQMKYSPSKFLEDSTSDAGNFCRNPSKNKGGPWCYTVDGSSWETCDIPDCPEDVGCKTTNLGLGIKDIKQEQNLDILVQGGMHRLSTQPINFWKIQRQMLEIFVEIQVKIQKDLGVIPQMEADGKPAIFQIVQKTLVAKQLNMD